MAKKPAKRSKSLAKEGRTAKKTSAGHRALAAEVAKKVIAGAFPLMKGMTGFDWMGMNAIDRLANVGGTVTGMFIGIDGHKLWLFQPEGVAWGVPGAASWSVPDPYYVPDGFLRSAV